MAFTRSLPFEDRGYFLRITSVVFVNCYTYSLNHGVFGNVGVTITKMFNPIHQTTE